MYNFKLFSRRKSSTKLISSFKVLILNLVKYRSIHALSGRAPINHRGSFLGDKNAFGIEIKTGLELNALQEYNLNNARTP